MVGHTYACVGLLALLAGASVVGMGPSGADARGAELRSLQAREAEIRAAFAEDREAWRQAMLRWHANGEAGDPPPLRTTGDVAQLERLQWRIFELSSPSR